MVESEKRKKQKRIETILSKYCLMAKGKKLSKHKKLGDLNLNLSTFLKFLIEASAEFNLQNSNKDIKQIRTVGDLINFID